MGWLPLGAPDAPHGEIGDCGMKTNRRNNWDRKQNKNDESELQSFRVWCWLPTRPPVCPSIFRDSERLRERIHPRLCFPGHGAQKVAVKQNGDRCLKIFIWSKKNYWKCNLIPDENTQNTEKKNMQTLLMPANVPCGPSFGGGGTAERAHRLVGSAARTRATRATAHGGGRG